MLEALATSPRHPHPDAANAGGGGGGGSGEKTHEGHVGKAVGGSGHRAVKVRGGRPI